MVHTTLDIFTSRLPSKTNGDSDFGLLYAVDDEVALYGWLTNTGIKIVVAVETPPGADGDGGGGGMGVRDGELKGVSFLLLLLPRLPLFWGKLTCGGGDGGRCLERFRRLILHWCVIRFTMATKPDPLRAGDF